MPESNSFMKKLKEIFELLCSGLTEKLGNSWIGVLGVQLAIACLTLTLCIGLAVKSKNQIKIGFIKALSLFYPISSFILFLQGQTTLFLFNQSGTQLDETIVLAILTILNDLLIALLCILHNISFSTCSPISYNHLCTRFNLIIIFTSCFSKILAFALPYIVSAQMDKQKQLNQYPIFLPLLHICLLTFLLYLKISTIIINLDSEIVEFTYFSQVATNFHWISLSLEFSILFIIFFTVVSSEKILAENCHFLIAVLWAFSYFTLQNYKTHVSYEFDLNGEKSIHSSPKAELFLLHLHQDLLKIDKQTQSSALSNMLRKHENQCRDPSCQCKNLNNKDQQYRKQYEKDIVISIMKTFAETFPESEKLLILISYLQLAAHQRYVDSIYQIIKVLKSQKRKSFWFKFLSQKYILSIQTYLLQKGIEMVLANIEKCAQSQQYLSLVMNKFAQMINLKTHFWSYFSKGLTNLKIFQDNIDQQLSIMKQFYHIENHIIEKHENSYILTSLLIAYQRFVLMRDKISKEVGDRATLIRSQHQETTVLKLQKSQKNSIEKSIYSYHACTIEISLNSSHLGSIVSVSRNIQAVFGYKANDMKGLNINKLMPNSMQEEHNFILENWKSKCSWDNIGKYRNIFSVTRQHVSFSTRIYLKPIVRSDGVNIVGGIFKENDKDYMIIDDRGYIVGAGSKYFQLLGNVLVGLPLDLICTQAANINQWAQAPLKSKYRSLFYSTRGLEHLLTQFIENKHSITSSQTQANLLKEIRKKQHSTSQQSNLQFQVEPYRIGRIKFFVIKLEAIISQAGHRKSMTASIADATNEADRVSSIKFAEDQQVGFLNCNSSIGSSATSSVQGFDTNISFFQSIFFQKSKIRDHKIITAMNIILISTIICIFWSCIKLLTNKKGYNELGQIMDAGDDFISNLQLVMISYNRGLSIMQYLFNIHENIQTGKQSEFQEQLIFSNYQSDLYHNTVSQQIANINVRISSLTKTPLNGHEIGLVKWISNNNHQNQVQVSTFILNYFYLIHDLKAQASILSHQLLHQNLSSTSLQAEQSYKIISHNVETMKINFPALLSQIFGHIKQFTIEFYKTVDTIEILSYFKVSFSCVLFLIILACLRKYYNFRQQQQINIIKQFQQFPIKLVHCLAFYFVNLQYVLDGDPRLKGYTQIKLKKDMEINNIETIFKQMQFVFEQSQIDNIEISANTGKSKLNFNEKTSYSLTVFYLVLFAIIIACNAAMILTEQQVLQSSEAVLEHKNKMVSSQNLLISTYFKFKSMHAANKLQRNFHESQLLLSAINTTSITFIQAIVNSMKSLTNLDNDYLNRMSLILNYSICNSNHLTIDQQMYDLCKAMEPSMILESGLSTYLNYFQRNLQLNLYQYIQSSTVTFQEIQKLTNLRLIDRSITFIFKLLGNVHSQMVKTLASVVNKKSILLNVVLFGQLCIYLAFILFIIYFYGIQHERTMHRIGRILLLPVRCLKNNRKMIKNFQHIIDYHHVK